MPERPVAGGRTAGREHAGPRDVFRLDSRPRAGRPPFRNRGSPHVLLDAFGPGSPTFAPAPDALLAIPDGFVERWP
jgi:hypothetical protein